MALIAGMLAEREWERYPPPPLAELADGAVLLAAVRDVARALAAGGE